MNFRTIRVRFETGYPIVVQFIFFLFIKNIADQVLSISCELVNNFDKLREILFDVSLCWWNASRRIVLLARHHHKTCPISNEASLRHVHQQGIWTTDIEVLDIANLCFIHGQFYVARYRVSSAKTFVCARSKNCCNVYSSCFVIIIIRYKTIQLFAVIIRNFCVYGNFPRINNIMNKYKYIS